MKRTTHLKSWLSIIMMLFMVGNAWGQANIHTSNVTFKTVSETFADLSNKVKINGTGYYCARIGSGTKKGAVTFTIPAGTNTIFMHVAGWATDEENILNVKIDGENTTVSPSEIKWTKDEGITAAAYVINDLNKVTEDYYKVISVSGVTSETTVTLETNDANQRAVVWGINTSKTYHVTYDGNGATSGEVPVDNNIYLPGESATALNKGTLERVGYEFKGWGENQNEAYYQPGATFTVDYNTTLYAIWGIKKDINVTWYVNGISYTDGNPTSSATFNSKVTNLPTSPEDPFDANLTFVGWTDQPIDGTTNTAPTTLFKSADKAPKINTDKDIKYYAVFAKECVSSTETLQKIENVADITNGTYVIMSYKGTGYIENEPSLKSSPAAIKIVKDSENNITISDDMKWNLTIENGIIKLESKSYTGNILWGGGDTYSAITRVGASSNDLTISKEKNTITYEWKAEKHKTYGVIIYANNGLAKRYLSLFYKPNEEDETIVGDWRNYKEGSSLTDPANLYKIESGVTHSDYTTHHIQVNVGSTGYSTLYYSDQYLVMPDDVTAKTYKLEGQNFVESKVYEAKSANLIIPKDEAVVIFSQEAFDKKATTPIFFSKTTIMSFKDNNNELKGTDEATDLSTLYTLNEIASNYFYALTRDKEKKNVGFYWMNETGTTFTNGAHKAYLLLPKSRAAGVKGFSLDGDFETAIVETLDGNNEVSESDAIYNLSGQRVNKVSKGIFIKNGKKYIAK